jgi:NTE family protein
VDYIRSMAQTMMEAHDRLYMEQETFVRTIPIPTLGVHTAEFDLSDERAQALYDAGRQAAEEFLSTWDFHAYIEQFRRGQVHRRRDLVISELNAAVSTGLVQTGRPLTEEAHG